MNKLLCALCLAIVCITTSGVTICQNPPLAQSAEPALTFQCNAVCSEEEPWYMGHRVCLQRCENSEVVCYVGGNGYGGAPSCFLNKVPR